jgi:hypothetical protein
LGLQRFKRAARSASAKLSGGTNRLSTRTKTTLVSAGLLLATGGMALKQQALASGGDHINRITGMTNDQTFALTLVTIMGILSIGGYLAYKIANKKKT